MDDREVRALVAKNIRAAATARGVTLTALADFATVSRAQMFNVLRGTTAPTIDWIAKVAEALDVEPWHLLAPRSQRPGFNRPRKA